MGDPEGVPQAPGLAQGLLRTAAAILAAVVASLPITSPLEADPALPHHERPGGISLARRKDTAPAGEVATLPTIGTILNLHTDEAVPLSDTEPSLDRFSDLLADTGMRMRIDVAPPLLDVLRALARKREGARVDIVSGFRSPKRNEMMRKKGRHVASHSQHTMGHAVDFRVEGMTVGEIVKALEGMKYKGGIGRYDQQHDLFVHVDVGPDRRWKGN
jgi:uncharacterized protein YcbK (DUF882 family)